MGAVTQFLGGGKGGSNAAGQLENLQVGNEGGINWGDMQNQINRRQAERSAMLDQSQSDQFRNQQMGLSEMAMAQARGEGPSLAQMQLQQATDANIAAQMAAAGSMRGIQGGTAQRQLANQAAMAGQQAAQQAAQLRLAEQQQAQSFAAQLAQAARGQDLSAAEANLQSELQNRQLRDAFQTQMLGIANQRDLGVMGARAGALQGAGQLREQGANRAGQAFGMLLRGGAAAAGVGGM